MRQNKGLIRVNSIKLYANKTLYRSIESLNRVTTFYLLLKKRIYNRKPALLFEQ